MSLTRSVRNRWKTRSDKAKTDSAITENSDSYRFESLRVNTSEGSRYTKCQFGTSDVPSTITYLLVWICSSIGVNREMWYKRDSSTRFSTKPIVRTPEGPPTFTLYSLFSRVVFCELKQVDQKCRNCRNDRRVLNMKNHF